MYIKSFSSGINSCVKSVISKSVHVKKSQQMNVGRGEEETRKDIP